MVNFQKLEMAFFEDRFDTTLYQIHLRSLRVVIFMYLLVFVVAVVSHLRLDLNIKINVNFVRDYVNFEKVTVTEFRYSFCFHLIFLNTIVPLLVNAKFQQNILTTRKPQQRTKHSKLG